MGQTLKQWLDEILVDPEKGNCTMLSCVHMVANAEKEVHTIKFGAKKWTTADLAELFMRKCRNFCSELSGVQMFQLLAFFNNESEPGPRRYFRVQGEGDILGQSNTEGANATGLASQAMRHLEAMAAIHVRNTGLLFEAQNETIRTLSVQLNNSRNENIQVFDALKTMLIEQATNVHIHKMAEIEAQNSADTRKSVIKLLPALANRLTGKEIMPESTADTALFEAITDHILKDEEAAKAMMSAATKFPPQIAGMLASRMEQIAKAKNEQKERDAKIVHSNGMDEDGVAPVAARH